MGWVATPDCCHGAAQLANMVKGLSAELLTSHLPCDYYLGEITVPDNDKAKYQVILDVLMRRIEIDTTAEDDNAASQETTAEDYI